MRNVVALAAVAALAVVTGAVEASPPSEPAPYSFHAKRYHRPGTPVILVLQNTGDERLRFSSPWTITRAKTGEVAAQFHWTRRERSLAPGETAIWEWDQTEGAHGSAPRPPEEAERVGPGSYELTLRAGGSTIERRLLVGRFFTAGFGGRDDTFVVFVAERKPLRQMKAEAKLAHEDKTLIVSGKVRGAARRYNGDWSYSMGPRSIVLGEVFVEVCDANPRYVERHREEWVGRRWCPWSSYVARAGR